MTHTKESIKQRLKDLGEGFLSLSSLPFGSYARIAKQLRDDETIQVFSSMAQLNGTKGVLIATENRVFFLSPLKSDEISFAKIVSVNYESALLKGEVEFTASGHSLKVKVPAPSVFADYVRSKLA